MSCCMSACVKAKLDDISPTDDIVWLGLQTSQQSMVRSQHPQTKGSPWGAADEAALDTIYKTIGPTGRLCKLKIWEESESKATFSSDRFCPHMTSSGYAWHHCIGWLGVRFTFSNLISRLLNAVMLEIAPPSPSLLTKTWCYLLLMHFLFLLIRFFTCTQPRAILYNDLCKKIKLKYDYIAKLLEFRKKSQSKRTNTSCCRPPPQHPYKNLAF